jgi:hypothetical protein
MSFIKSNSGSWKWVQSMQNLILHRMVIFLFTGKTLVKISLGSMFSLLHVYLSIYDVEVRISLFRSNSGPWKWVHFMQNQILRRMVILLFTGKTLVKISPRSFFSPLHVYASYMMLKWEFLSSEVIPVRGNEFIRCRI